MVELFWFIQIYHISESNAVMLILAPKLLEILMRLDYKDSGPSASSQERVPKFDGFLLV